jgi:hypothetical protein
MQNCKNIYLFINSIAIISRGRKFIANAICHDLGQFFNGGKPCSGSPSSQSQMKRCHCMCLGACVWIGMRIPTGGETVWEFSSANTWVKPKGLLTEVEARTAETCPLYLAVRCWEYGRLGVCPVRELPNKSVIWRLRLPMSAFISPTVAFHMSVCSPMNDIFASALIGYKASPWPSS